MPGITPSNTHTTRDGKHVIVGANGDAIFKRLMMAMGRDDLAADATLADNAGRDARRDELYALIGEWVGQHDAAEVLAILGQAEVPASHIYSVEDMFRDAQFAARGMIERHALPDGRALAVPGVVPKLTKTPGGTEWLGPALGQHNDEVLAALGYDTEQRAALKASGAI
jgi:formyl-CoA transferase